jgi:hypothetical protein
MLSLLLSAVVPDDEEEEEARQEQRNNGGVTSCFSSSSSSAEAPSPLLSNLFSASFTQVLPPPGPDMLRWSQGAMGS